MFSLTVLVPVKLDVFSTFFFVHFNNNMENVKLPLRVIRS